MEKIKCHFYDELLSKDESTCLKNIADDAMLRNEFLNFLLKNDYENFCPNHCNLPRHYVTLEDFRNYSLHKSMGDANTSQQLKETYLDKRKVLKPEVRENGLLFRAGCTEIVDKEFIMTSYGCYICQRNFISLCEYDDHIKFHGKDEDVLPRPTKWSKCWRPTFTILYNHCVDTNLLNFKMIADKDIVIEKIVIVRPELRKLMHHVERSKIQISKENRTYHLAVDCFLFDIDKEQPLFVIYRCCDETVTRKVEKYIFFRKEQFPKSNISIISSSVPQHAQLILKYQLAQHFPSAEIRYLYKTRYKEEIIITRNPILMQYLLERKLKDSNYTQILSFLLQMEDQSTLGDYEKFTLTNPAVQYLGRLDYSVTFPQEIKNASDKFLVEFDEVVVSPCRESYYDDNVFETKSRKDAKQKCVGYIYKVQNNKVFFTLRTKLYIWKGRTFKIKFYPHRIPFRYQYEAIQRMAKYNHVLRVLLPPENVSAQISPVMLNFFNKSVENNPEQSQAVRNIVSTTTSVAPYILFGPPGTGKSTTVVESVLQLWKTKPLSKILVTSGSNTACDEVAKRLCKVFEQINGEGPNLLRIYAISYERKMDNFEELLVEASNFAHGYHFYPSLDSIYLFRIVVATLTICGKLVQGAISDTHFTHIFIDECAASTEPEALVGIVGLMGPKTKLILSGDPKQLGAVLKCEEAENFGLGISMMERLLSMKCYAVNPKTHEYDRSIQTILRRNFRSTFGILSISNKLCYNSQLLACAKPEMTNWAKGWNKLPVKNCPILFHVVHGETVIDKGETSSRNLDEIRIVMRYVRDLLKNGINGRKVLQREIGVISPYKRQYTLIREALNSEGMSKVETGSAETFQGREKPIIIISTVKSWKNIGFLKNIKRLNVMLTRAQALMIIVGNPETLQNDNNWYQVLKYFEKQKAFKGQAFKLKPAPIQFNVDLLPSVPKVCNDVKNKEPNSQNETSSSKIEKYVDTDRQKDAFKMNSQNSQQHNIATNCQSGTTSNAKAGKYIDADRQEVTDDREFSFVENLLNFDQAKMVLNCQPVLASKSKPENYIALNQQEEDSCKMASLHIENLQSALKHKEANCQLKPTSNSAPENYIVSDRQKEAVYRMTPFAENLQISDQDKKEKGNYLATTSNSDRQEEAFYRMASLLAGNSKIHPQYKDTLKQEIKCDSETESYFASNRQEEAFYRMASLHIGNLQSPQQHKEANCELKPTSKSAAGNYIDSERQKETAYRMTSFAENLKISDQDKKEKGNYLATTSNSYRQEEAFYRMASLLAGNSNIPPQYNKDTLKQEIKSVSETESYSASNRQEEAFYRMASLHIENLQSPQQHKEANCKLKSTSKSVAGNYIDSDRQKDVACRMSSFAENFQNSDLDKMEKSNYLEASNSNRQEEAFYKMASLLAENSHISLQYKVTSFQQELNNSKIDHYIASDRQEEAFYKVASLLVEDSQILPQYNKEPNCQQGTTTNSKIGNLDQQERSAYKTTSLLLENLLNPNLDCLQKTCSRRAERRRKTKERKKEIKRERKRAEEEAAQEKQKEMIKQKKDRKPMENLQNSQQNISTANKSANFNNSLQQNIEGTIKTIYSNTRNDIFLDRHLLPRTVREESAVVPTATVRPMIFNDINNKETNSQHEPKNNPNNGKKKRARARKREKEVIDSFYTMASLLLEDLENPQQNNNTADSSNSKNSMPQNLLEPLLEKRYINMVTDIGTDRFNLEKTFPNETVGVHIAAVRPTVSNDINKETNWQQQTTSNPKNEKRRGAKISKRENEEVNAFCAMASLELEETAAIPSNLNTIHLNIVEPQIHKTHSNVVGDVGADRLWLEDTFCKQPALVLSATVHSNDIEAAPQNQSVFERPTTHAPTYEKTGENQGPQTYEDYQPSYKMLPPNRKYVPPKLKGESNCVIL